MGGSPKAPLRILRDPREYLQRTDWIGMTVLELDQKKRTCLRTCRVEEQSRERVAPFAALFEEVLTEERGQKTELVLEIPGESPRCKIQVASRTDSRRVGSTGERTVHGPHHSLAVVGGLSLSVILVFMGGAILWILVMLCPPIRRES